MAFQGTQLKFYWDSVLDDTGITITGTPTTANINNALAPTEISNWQGISTSPHSLMFDAGAGNVIDADYLSVVGHNLGGSTLYVEHSSSTAFVGEHVQISRIVVPATQTSPIVSEWTTIGGRRAWRLSIHQGATLSTFAYISILMLGTRSELGYISAPYDPYSQNMHADANLSQAGYLTGTHIKYVERSMQISLRNVSTTIYEKIKTWWENHAMNNFVVSWNSTGSTAGNSGDAWLMRSDSIFTNPVSDDYIRNVEINLIGRKE